MFTCLCLCLQREDDLSDLIMKVIKQGLEGLVLKDTKVSNIPGHDITILVTDWSMMMS